MLVTSPLSLAFPSTLVWVLLQGYAAGYGICLGVDTEGRIGTISHGVGVCLYVLPVVARCIYRIFMCIVVTKDCLNWVVWGLGMMSGVQRNG